jgi:hypothetical protein
MRQRVQLIDFDRGEDALGRNLRFHDGGELTLERGPQLFQLFPRQVRRKAFGQRIVIRLSQGDQILGSTALMLAKRLLQRKHS